MAQPIGLPMRFFRFLKREHVCLRRDFDRVFRDKSTAADALLVVHVVRNELEWSRIGISVSKRLGNAVRRNSVRRRIREAFRLSKAELPVGYDIVCVARPKATGKNADFARSLRRLVPRAIKKRGAG